MSYVDSQGQRHFRPKGQDAPQDGQQPKNNNSDRPPSNLRQNEPTNASSGGPPNPSKQGGGGGGDGNNSGQVGLSPEDYGLVIKNSGDETWCYSLRSLTSIVMRTCPTTAFENKSFVSYALSQFGGIDMTGSDLITKWLKEATHLTESAHRLDMVQIRDLFHHHSNGFPHLDKNIGSDPRGPGKP